MNLIHQTILLISAATQRFKCFKGTCTDNFSRVASDDRHWCYITNNHRTDANDAPLSQRDSLEGCSVRSEICTTLQVHICANAGIIGDIGVISQFRVMPDKAVPKETDMVTYFGVWPYMNQRHNRYTVIDLRILRYYGCRMDNGCETL